LKTGAVTDVAIENLSKDLPVLSIDEKGANIENDGGKNMGSVLSKNGLSKEQDNNSTSFGADSGEKECLANDNNSAGNLYNTSPYYGVKTHYSDKPNIKTNQALKNS